MSASKQVREAGLKSIAQVAELTGEDVTKLARWARDRPRLFKIIIGGCLQVVKANNNQGDV
jgi:hypothetical protein